MRKSIVISGIIMAFILGSLVSGPFATAQMGTPFLQEEIDAITDLVLDLLDQLSPNVFVLHYEQTELETVLPNQFITLAEWEILRNSTAAAYELVLNDSSIYANINRTINIGWYKSTDGTTWSGIDLISARNFGFIADQDFEIQKSITPSINFIAFAAENLDEEGDPGEVKSFSGTITIHLPPGHSLNQTCCPR